MKQSNWIGRIISTIRNMKLQSKLMGGYLLGCVIPVLVVSTLIYTQSVAGLEDSSQEFATLYTSQIENSLDQLMQEYDKITKSVLVDKDFISKLRDTKKMSMDELILQRETVRSTLRRVALLKQDIDTVMLISADSTVFQYTNTVSTVNESALLSQVWYKRTRNTDDTFFVTGLHDRSYYEDKGVGAIVTVGRMLLTADGAFAGWLLLDLDPFTLLAPNPDFVLARDKYAMSVIISDALGETVYHSDAASGKVSWKHVLDSGINYTGDVSDKDRIIISGSTKLGQLIIKTEIPRQKLLLRIQKIQAVTGIVILIGFIIMAFVSVGLNYAISKPIKSLRRSMKQAEAGQYMPIEKVQSHDEIGSLVKSYNNMIITIRTLIEDVYMAEIKQRQAKFLALQNQINPHMLYNTLESIRMKALMKEDQEVADMIKILARMFRLVLNKEGRKHSIKDELDYTINYLKLQNIRFDDRFRLDIRLSDDMLKCGIIPLVFQPIVENSISHGFIDYTQSMTIVIEGSWTEDDGVLIRIMDDGIGMTRDKQEELYALIEEAESAKYKVEQSEESVGKGLGLKNIAERIKLHYGDRYYLNIDSKDGIGTSIEIHIPKMFI
ncbi:cache domain-containing sensor histidine kinase [Paenibacillus andongensis]|uniref:cache domain-containing sensor histidine kinase n=1 Tax=Paenibacillus andongensis TaxID=2975482 RepID=UPI0021BB51AE|nr:histidine kinase [Paenibacillus andongensis]